jgi:hypothetical protein
MDSWYFPEERSEEEKNIDIKYREESDRLDNKMKSLIGKTVKDILGNGLSGYIIVFDDETMLTATDSEFGGNAFDFCDKDGLGVVL